MTYWHWTSDNTKVQKKISDFSKTPPLPTSGHGFLFHHLLDSISKPAFRFLLVFEPKNRQKLLKDQKTGKLGNLGPISWKPHMSIYVYYIITLCMTCR